MNNFVSLINAIKSSNDPNSMVSSMARMNPEVSSLLSMTSRNGGTAKQAFYEMCKQKGVDPDSILKTLR